MLDLLTGFINELREAGLPVSLTENLDAMEAVTHIPIEDRDAFKYALGSTLVKNHTHWKAFEIVFEVYFSMRGPEYGLLEPDLPLDDLPEDAQTGEGDPDRAGMRGGGGNALSPEELAEMLFQALLRGDNSLMRAIARQAVRRYAGMEPGRPVGGTYYLYRTLRNLDLDNVLERLLQSNREQAPGPLTSLEERLEKDEFQSRIDQLKKEIEAEIRRRLVADRGVEAMAKTLRKPLPEDVEFMHASREEMLALRKALYPLARKLAVRLARKRRHGRKGPLDFRNTMRHSLSYGGVPGRAEVQVPAPGQARDHGRGRHLRFGRRVRAVHAASRLRDLVAVLACAGVRVHRRPRRSHALLRRRRRHHRSRAPRQHRSRCGVGRRSLRLRPRVRRVPREVRPRRRPQDVGDPVGRRPQQLPRVAGMDRQDLQHKARNVFWLNPEPRSYWDTGDSILSEYGTHCDGVFEVRNLRQLEAFVEHLV